MLKQGILLEEWIKAVCLYGADPKQGETYKGVLVYDQNICNEDFHGVYCHAITKDDKLLISDTERRRFFFISDGWGVLEGVIVGLSATAVYEFGKDNITAADVQSEIERIETEAGIKTGFPKALAARHKIKLLKEIAAVI